MSSQPLHVLLASGVQIIQQNLITKTYKPFLIFNCIFFSPFRHFHFSGIRIKINFNQKSRLYYITISIRVQHVYLLFQSVFSMYILLLFMYDYIFWVNGMTVTYM